MNCLSCKKEENTTGKNYSFHVLEVQTLHVRDLTGEKRVQALGRFQDFTVCETCAREKMEKNLSAKKSVVAACLPFCLIFLVGIAVSILMWNGPGPIRFFGIAAVACGVLGVFDKIRTGMRHRLEFQKLSEEEALKKAAWEVVLEQAPKKAEDSDLTYIPINKKTLAMKKGDLMNVFDLLPEIAVKAYNHIRSEK